jgi:hypothetical protein
MREVAIRELAEGSLTLRQLGREIMARMGRGEGGSESAGEKRAQMHI